MSNFLTPEWIVRRALMSLKSNTVAAQLFYRDVESEFNAGFKKGEDVSLKRPTKPNITEYNGSSVSDDDVNETPVKVTLEKHFDANIKITARHQKLGMDSFVTQVLDPYMIGMAEKIDTYALSKLKHLPNVSAATPGALPTTIAEVAMMLKTGGDLKMPVKGRSAIIDTELEAQLLGIDNFITADKIGDDGTALREASLGRKMGTNWFMDQNVDNSTFTTGTAVTGVTNGVVNAQAGAVLSIAIDGFGVSTTLKAGDILTFAETGESVAVKSNVTSDGAGAFATVALAEPLHYDLSDGTAVTVYDGGGNDSALVGAVFDRNAIALTAVPLELPISTQNAFFVSDGGINLRGVWAYDRQLKADIFSLDVLVGAAVIDGRLGYQIRKNL